MHRTSLFLTVLTATVYSSPWPYLTSIVAPAPLGPLKNGAAASGGAGSSIAGWMTSATGDRKIQILSEYSKITSEARGVAVEKSNDARVGVKAIRTVGTGTTFGQGYGNTVGSAGGTASSPNGGPSFTNASTSLVGLGTGGLGGLPPFLGNIPGFSTPAPPAPSLTAPTSGTTVPSPPLARNTTTTTEEPVTIGLLVDPEGTDISS